MVSQSDMVPVLVEVTALWRKRHWSYNNNTKCLISSCDKDLEGKVNNVMGACNWGQGGGFALCRSTASMKDIGAEIGTE